LTIETTLYYMQEIAVHTDELVVDLRGLFDKNA